MQQDHACLRRLSGCWAGRRGGGGRTGRQVDREAGRQGGRQTGRHASRGGINAGGVGLVSGSEEAGSILASPCMAGCGGLPPCPAPLPWSPLSFTGLSPLPAPPLPPLPPLSPLLPCMAVGGASGPDRAGARPPSSPLPSCMARAGLMTGMCEGSCESARAASSEVHEEARGAGGGVVRPFSPPRRGGARGQTGPAWRREGSVPSGGGGGQAMQMHWSSKHGGGGMEGRGRGKGRACTRRGVVGQEQGRAGREEGQGEAGHSGKGFGRGGSAQEGEGRGGGRASRRGVATGKRPCVGVVGGRA